ncbi:fungal-specific transcription factor domain-containing protein [Xylaria cubensis]|nr:fungal-specific transcription factor domain-containing protein [Xylaria cubensis]
MDLASSETIVRNDTLSESTKPNRRAKRKRQISGSSVRLFWPKENNHRRAIVGVSPPDHVAGHGNQYTSASRFVHISVSDVEMHHRLTVAGANETTPPVLSVPLPWNPQKLQVNDKDLLYYFQHVAAQALATFGQDPTDLGNVLLRIAVSSSTESATAVLRSILAFASLHRYGMQSEALKLKVSALEALGASGSPYINKSIVVHHVATAMLLYSFEVHQSSPTSGDWVPYMCGIENLMRTAGLDLRGCEQYDIACLLDWVCYNDIISRFSLRHWDGSGQGIRTLPEPPSILTQSSYASQSDATVLMLFAETYDSAPLGEHSCKVTTNQEEFVRILDWRLRSTSTADEAFRLAALVYLDRITDSLIIEPSRTQENITRAFAHLSKLPYYKRQLPIFILGCEARSDEQRAIILDLISRTEENTAVRSFNHVKVLLAAVWAQDDLVDEQTGGLNYGNKLTSTISRCSFPPSFV